MNEGDRLDTHQPGIQHRTAQVDQRTGINRWRLFEGWRSAKSMEWDMEQVPCQHEVPDTKAGGIIMMAGAAFFVGMPTLYLIMSILDGEFKPAMLILLVLTVIGIGLFLLGLYLFSACTVTEFDGKTFRYRHKSVFGSKAWDESLSKYEGILARSEYHSGGRNSSPSYTLYIVELMHPDKQRRITLWQSRSSSGHRASWKKFSRQLALPALKQDEDGEEYTRSDAEDLDKSVRELAAEGKLEITFDSVANVPEKLELDIQGDQLEVVICNRMMPPGIMLTVMLIFFGPLATVTIWGGFFSVASNIFSRIVAVFVGVFIVFIVYRGIWLSVTTPLVRINRKGLHILRRTPWGETQGTRIRADAIEDVRVGKATDRQNSSSVVVETDAGNHAIGARLDKDALEWLKNCILNKIATEEDGYEL